MSKLLGSLFLISAFCIVVVSQGAHKLPGFIAGRVTERSTNQPLTAKVSVNGGKPFQTHKHGSFRLEIEPGVYSVRIEADGFAPVLINQVGITGGLALPQNSASQAVCLILGEPLS